MYAIQDIRKTITDPTPFYAWVGLVDKAVDQVRTASDEAGKKAVELSSQLKPEVLAERAQDVAAQRVELVQSLPQRVEKSGKAVFAQAEERYVGLSKRGAAVIAELRKQQEAQTQQVIDQGKATAASARKAAESAQSLASKTVLTGRKEVAKQVGTVAGTVETAADKLGDSARTEVRSTAARVGQADKPAKKAAPKKAAAKKSAPKKAAAKKATKPTAKPAAKKAPAKNASAAKTATQRPAAKKTTAPAANKTAAPAAKKAATPAPKATTTPAATPVNDSKATDSKA